MDTNLGKERRECKDDSINFWRVKVVKGDSKLE
jgi:hypothetical protein